ncbi:pentatricopeptide repeat-containing protein At5g44230 [Aristolochia californica]|uniref:pentatricopeptide repeat-containing protein At5g44230 n=1 Tax=Aristolochia californica TaxID=171875 RepID=UPI0035D5C039
MLAGRCCRETRISFAVAPLLHEHFPSPLLGISSNDSFRGCRRVLESRLISALDGCDCLVHLKHVHGHLLRAGLDQSSFVLAKLLRTLTNLNIPVEGYARQLFDQVRHPNPFLYTAIIRGYALQGPIQQAFVLFTRMRITETPPLTFTFSALFKASAVALDAGVGAQVHSQIVRLGGFDLDLYVNNTLIDMYIKCECFDDARKVFDTMPHRDVLSWTSLIVGYVRRGDMEKSSELFDQMGEKDMVAWTTMITGNAQNSRPREALRIFEQMWSMGIETDEVTLVGVISACAQLGSLKYGQWLRFIARQRGLDQNVIAGSALVDMFAKCGSLDEAREAFNAVKEKNVFTYSAMIVGLAMHGRALPAMQLFEEMVITETEPNGVTFIGVLTACSHAGYVDQGRQYFAIMSEKYQIAPTSDHYACMVDLLGRAGLVEEAYDLIQSMPVGIKLHGGVWGALLGACRLHGRPHIAAVASKHLFELEPDGIGNYVLLANIYASAGLWAEVVKVRKMMREKGLKKNPGCSWVEAKDGRLHEFFASGRTHPRYNEIMTVLEELLERLKQSGYVPILSCVIYDIGDSEKEQLLKTHSEKLALAFSLLDTSQGSVIRIAKNIRMCEDCHVFMCLASQITGREIVVRDNMRFHHFKDGLCSCGNFW